MLASIGIGSWLLGSTGLSVQLENRNFPPSLAHWFGTDWLGRDMLSRTVKGLALSIQVGLLGAACSAVIAAVMGLMAATLGKTADRIISWLIDVFLSVPHLVMLILIAFVCGGGLKGVAIGIMLTHWPSLARVIRAEALQLMSAEYVLVSSKLGRSRYWIATRHLAPHLFPQLLVGFLLLFPHAVLHEAAITFIGLGMSPHQPAIGIILSESMRYLSTGMWWLAVFPGLGLLATVRAFDKLGNHLRQLIDPRNAHL
ncbi:ABC transporter permease [Paenibacillus sp. FSL H8-0548]|uniref:ABC transporter permease n=1 Tax=Paenibacillus sp. FSL H8-0548 TaxID=1920422 RepID=UPI002116FB1F|nr:ABC transporter permease [Paenibacillus sp. FSL H8-0548]